MLESWHDSPSPNKSIHLDPNEESEMLQTIVSNFA